jgi:hypothetical protein
MLLLMNMRLKRHVDNHPLSQLEPHRHAATPPHRHTATPPHRHAATLPHTIPRSASFSQYHTLCRATLPHYHAATLPPHCTMGEENKHWRLHAQQ